MEYIRDERYFYHQKRIKLIIPNLVVVLLSLGVTSVFPSWPNRQHGRRVVARSRLRMVGSAWYVIIYHIYTHALEWARACPRMNTR